MTIHETARKAAIIAAMTAVALSANLSVAAVANAGEGHWSIGKGVQCRLVMGKVVCTKSRP